MSRPELRAVDDLCRLVRAAQRLGCRVRLEGVTTELRELLDLAGVTSLLVDGPTEISDQEPDLR